MKKQYLLFAVLWVLFFGGACKKVVKENKAQQTAIHYLYQPALISDTFSRSIWHHAIDFRGYDVEKQQLYFIVKKELGKKDMLSMLTIDPAKIEYAQCDTGMCEFGGMRGIIDGYYAFRIPCSNLKVDTNTTFSYKYYDTVRQISFRQLMNELDEKYFYNTPRMIDLTHYFGREVYAANMGAYISVKGNNNVVRHLADKITAGLKTNEEKAQALLHYVTNNIAYSYEDLWYEAEVAKRAHEVLLSGDGDCSAKTTLYASLLEQCDIPYCLLYYKHHINVGVLGAFPEENGYKAEVNQKQYAVAETTVEDFMIGKTKVREHEILDDVLFYQDPHRSPHIYNAKTKEQFEFVEFAED